MRIFFGSERCVLAFPSLGLVLKFPSPHRASWVWQHKDQSVCWRLRQWFPQAKFFIKRAIAQNRRERAVWKASRDSFFASTPFSFFGLMNVQSYFKASEGNTLDKQLHEKMYDVLS